MNPSSQSGKEGDCLVVLYNKIISNFDIILNNAKMIRSYVEKVLQLGESNMIDYRIVWSDTDVMR